MTQNLSKIDPRTKVGVYGWIRKAEKELRLTHIPSEISDICVLYYYQYEIFDVVSIQVKVSEDRRSIAKLSGGWNNTNYGIMEIESNTNNIYCWDFKMKKLHSYHVMIGIMDKKYMNADRYFLRDAKKVTYCQWGAGYTFNTMKGKWPSQSLDREHLFQQGDKVSMRLDLSESKLTFVINDRVQINAYNDIPKSDEIQYKMFVTMWNRDICVEILNFAIQ